MLLCAYSRLREHLDHSLQLPKALAYLPCSSVATPALLVLSSDACFNFECETREARSLEGEAMEQRRQSLFRRKGLRASCCSRAGGFRRLLALSSIPAASWDRNRGLYCSNGRKAFPGLSFSVSRGTHNTVEAMAHDFMLEDADWRDIGEVEITSAPRLSVADWRRLSL